MSLFDAFFGGLFGGFPDITSGPVVERPKLPVEKPLTPLEKAIRDTVREKVDEFIPPDSTVGQIIHKERQEADQHDEMLENQENAYKNLFYDESDAEDKPCFDLADHLFIRVGAITHHGIYVGHNEVIHYSTNAEGNIVIHRASLSEFAEGQKVYCMKESASPLKYSKYEALRRAEVRLNEHKYSIIGNNCEQFVRWCRNGGEQWVWERT